MHPGILLTVQARKQICQKDTFLLLPPLHLSILSSLKIMDTSFQFQSYGSACKIAFTGNMILCPRTFSGLHVC